MAAIRFDPYIGCNFLLLRLPIIIGGFKEISGLESHVELKTYAEGGRNDYLHQIPGEVRHAPIVLSRGLIDSNALWIWYEDVSRGIIRRNPTIIMLLDQGGIPAMWWSVKGAIAVKWTGPKLDGTSSEIAVESLELAHQGISKPIASKLVTNLRAAIDVAKGFI